MQRDGCVPTLVILGIVGALICLALISGGIAIVLAFSPMGITIPTVQSQEVASQEALPPSHEGGWVSNTGDIWSTPTPGPPPTVEQSVPNAPLDGYLGGFPDAGVLADPPPGAIQVTAIFSYYIPQRGGVNCGSFRSAIPDRAYEFPYADKSHGWCWSRMSNGEHWEYFMGRAVACPQEYPFGTRVYAFGREWICKDHGGAIVRTPDGDWFDFLTTIPPLSFRTHFTVWVVYP